jgi:hypothetical protein
LVAIDSEYAWPKAIRGVYFSRLHFTSRSRHRLLETSKSRLMRSTQSLRSKHTTVETEREFHIHSCRVLVGVLHTLQRSGKRNNQKKGSNCCHHSLLLCQQGETAAGTLSTNTTDAA